MQFSVLLGMARYPHTPLGKTALTLTTSHFYCSLHTLFILQMYGG